MPTRSFAGLIGVGIDLTSVHRIQLLATRRSFPRVASRILSPEEYVLFNALPEDVARQTRFLAVRWAVKEAAYKALHPLVKPTWKELSFLGPEGRANKPELSYTPLGLNVKVRLLASVSHDGKDPENQFVIAIVNAMDLEIPTSSDTDPLVSEGVL